MLPLTVYAPPDRAVNKTYSTKVLPAPVSAGQLFLFIFLIAVVTPAAMLLVYMFTY